MIQLFGMQRSAELRAKELFEAADRAQDKAMADFLRKQAEDIAFMPLQISRAWTYDVLFASAGGLAVGAGMSAVIAML